MCIPPKPGNIHRKKSASVHRLPPAPSSEGGIFLEPSLYPTGSGSFLPVLGGTGGYLRTLVSYWGCCLLTDTSMPDGSQVEASSRPEPLRVPFLTAVFPERSPADLDWRCDRSFREESWRHSCWSRPSGKIGGPPKSGKFEEGFIKELFTKV